MALPPPGPHAAQVAEHADLPPVAHHIPAAAPKPPAQGPDVVVYGYWPYWVGDLDPAWLTGLTHLAIFSVGLESDGSLSSQSHWTGVAADAVAAAHAAGVKVHLCVTSFDSNTMSAVLASPTRRATAIANLASLVDTYGADGVNLDFEGMPSSLKEDLVVFVHELKAATPEVWLATPVIDWSGAYDYSELSDAADGLFIMGYEFHGTWGSPGPNDPISESSTWGSYCLDWSIADYEGSGAPRAKIVMGLPLYGHTWDGATESVPGSASGDAWSVVQTECDEIKSTYGAQWDEGSESVYTVGGGRQTWCDDVETTRLRVAWAVVEGLQGVGFWALGYEGEGFWEMMAEETVFDGTDGGGTDGGGTDGGGTDGGGSDGGGTDGGGSSDTDEPVGQRIPAQAEPVAGCTHANPASFPALLLLAGLLIRRRGQPASRSPGC